MAFPLTLINSLELLVCTWGGPEKGPQGDSLMQKRSSQPSSAWACLGDDEAKHFNVGEGT